MIQILTKKGDKYTMYAMKKSRVITYYVFKTKNNKYLRLESDFDNRKNYGLKDGDELLKFLEVESPSDAWGYQNLKQVKEDYLLFLSGKEKIEPSNDYVYYNYNNIEIIGFEKVIDTHIIETETDFYDLSHIQENKK